MADTDVLPSTGAWHDDRPAGSDPSDHSATATGEIARDGRRATKVEIAIPVYNEEEMLDSSIRRLRSYLDRSFPFEASIVIVDNASIDGTWEIARRLSSELEGVAAIHLDQKGRGRAIRSAWTTSRSEVVAYMDVDLSTDLDGLLPLVAPLLSGHSQVAIGSRIATGSHVLRGGKREFISRTYNLILRSTLRCRFSDAQCGFKAMRRDAVEPLLNLVEDQAWFFDTELLIQAERNGFRIHEVSVDWIDDPDTRVHIVNTAREDLKGVWRLARQRIDLPEAGYKHATTEQRSAFEYTARWPGTPASGFSAQSPTWPSSSCSGTRSACSRPISSPPRPQPHSTLWPIRLFTFRAKHGGHIRQAALAGALSFAVGIGLTSAALAFTDLIGRTTTLAEGIAILAGMVAALVRAIRAPEGVGLQEPHEGGTVEPGCGAR